MADRDVEAEKEHVLREAVARRQRLEELAMQYEQLRTNIATLRDVGVEAGFKSLVNIGRDFFVQAKVEDSSRIVVTVGAGVAVEMTREEAIAFIEVKQKSLQSAVNASARHCAELAALVRHSIHPQ